jgi:hypothetical protein
MAKRYSLKFLPINRLEVGDAQIQSFEVDDRQICIVSVPNLSEAEVVEFRETWEKIIGDQVDLLITNYEVDLTRIEIEEVDPPTRYEREPPI